MNQNFQDFFINCKKCVLENPRSFYGQFSIGPFKNSQSLTIANALRRTLLTEISNIAITHVEIEGVFHEYSTIEGVRESVLDILLNFKQIVLKTSSHLTKPLFGYLNVRGPGIVRVSDLKLPPSIQYVDPDQYIATLDEKGKLSSKFLISDFSHFLALNLGNQKKDLIITEETFYPEKNQKNKKYILQQNNLTAKRSALQSDDKGLKVSHGRMDRENQSTSSAPALKGKSGWDSWGGAPESNETKNSSKLALFSLSDPINSNKMKNFMEVDANFNPILKVNYLIENLEPVGQFQNQVIHLELWTNGSLHPRKALYFTFDFLRNIFNKFEDMKYLNLHFNNQFFESEKTLIKILKNYEYDLGFYDVLSLKNLMHLSNSSFHQNLSQPHFPSDHSSALPRFAQKIDISPKNIVEIDTVGTSNDRYKNENQKIEKNEAFTVQTLNLPHRITHCLIQNNLLTIPELLKYTPKELQHFCGIGNYSLSLIQKKLKKKGFFLKQKKNHI